VPEVRWLPKALDDLGCLYDFLAEKNPTAARKGAEAIIRASHQLESFPAIGKPLTEESSTRELFVPFGHGAYVLRYRFDARGEVVVMRVWHGREQR
jgi:plasmid stabilization system protein ParE